ALPATAESYPLISAADFDSARSYCIGPSIIASLKLQALTIVSFMTVEAIFSFTFSTAEMRAILGSLIPSLPAAVIVFSIILILVSVFGSIFIAASLIITGLW